jgi:hypothetical protein
MFSDEHLEKTKLAAMPDKEKKLYRKEKRLAAQQASLPKQDPSTDDLQI